MKKLLISLAMALAFAAPAMAAVQEFETLIIDVPSGWTPQAQPRDPSMPQVGGVVLSGPQDNIVAVVASAPAEGKSAKEIADLTAQALSAPAPKAEGNGYLIHFNAQGMEGDMYLTVTKDVAVMTTMIGSHPDLMKIAKSAKPK